MDLLICLDYGLDNEKIDKEILTCLRRGADLCAGNHYALRNAKQEGNLTALKVLVRAYRKNSSAKLSYDKLLLSLHPKKDKKLKTQLFVF